MDFLREHYSTEMVRFIYSTYQLNVSVEVLTAAAAGHVMDTLNNTAMYADRMHG